MRSCSIPWRGLGLVALLLGLSGPLTVGAYGDPNTDETMTIGATICEAESTETVESGDCRAFGDLTATVTYADGSAAGSCVIELVETPNGTASICAVTIPFETTVTVSVDDSAVPAGYVLRENDVLFTSTTMEQGGGESNDVSFLILQAPGSGSGETPGDETPGQESTGPSAPAPDATEPTGAEATQPADEAASDTPAAAPGAAGTGSPASIYAGDCDIDVASADAVAVLSETTLPEGDARGADGASAVETSVTTLDLPLDDILAEDHVLVVFDENDDTVALACGAVGGIVTEDGTLAFGLAAVGESRFSGVATLTDDGDQTEATIFLAEDLSADTSPAT